VEWPGIAEPGLEKRVAARVTLEHRGGDSRVLTIE
jgi:hypothetical protein